MSTMTEERPLILVDVDGVLNAFSRRLLPGCKIHRIGNGPNPTEVMLNPQHGAWLKELAAETGGELAWCTWWSNPGKELGPLTGLDMPAVPIDKRVQGSIGRCKAVAAAKYAGERPYVWFDDMLAAKYETRQLRGRDRAHVVHVHDITGLRERDIDEARAWLRRREAGVRERRQRELEEAFGSAA